MNKSVKKGLLAVGVLVATSQTAFCAVDVTGVVLDTAAVETIAGTMLGALAIIWVARKVVSFLK